MFRFSKVAEVLLPNHEMKVKLRTQFLSSNVTYAAYLVLKPDSSRRAIDNYAAYSLIYRLNNIRESYISYPSRMEDNGWWMFELFQTLNLKRTFDFEVTFLMLERPFGYRPYLMFEGILFLPIKKFQDENEIEKSELRNLSTSNIEWDNQLPSDYKQFIYHSNKEMMKMPQSDVIFPTKEEAYNILSHGVLIKVNNELNMWFWITKLNGMKCFMLPPTLLSYNEQLVKIKRISSKESRIGNVLHLSSSKVVAMCFKIPNSAFSTNATYGCFFVYKMPYNFGWETLVTMKLEDGNVSLNRRHGKLITYLSIPKSPVIGSHGVLRSKKPINQLKTIQLPRKRKDDWLELNLGNKSGIQWMNMQHDKQFDHFWKRNNTSIGKSCFLQCLTDNDPNDNFTLDPRYISINIYMWPFCNATETPELIVQGIEFRPV
ncbi:hypothetical protein R6Q57_023124 [Mikania cordata]